MPRQRRAFRVVGLVGLLVVALLSGCAEIPTTGRVIEAAPARVQQPQIPVAAKYEPRPGDDERQIVQGFLNAMTSYTPDYQMARAYLTAEANDEWDPSAQTQIFDGSRGFGLTLVREGLVHMSVPLVALIGEDRNYESSGQDQVLELDLQLQRVNDEWRITNPPQGLVMSEYFFDREFDAYDLYFFDPDFEVLVPEPVYLPRRGNLSTMLAQSLLEGPSQWLTPAVRTAFPPGTRLVLPSVPVVSGTAEIDLTSPVLAATQDQRDQMMAQLAWTLRQVPSVLRIRVDVGGVSLVGPLSGETSRSIRDYRQYGSNPLTGDAPVYAIRDGAVVSIAGDTTELVGGPLGHGEVRARSVAVELRTRHAAVVNESGTRVLGARFTGGDPPAELATGSDFAAPAWDRTGLLWLADRSPSGSRLWTVNSDGEKRPVRAPGLESQRIESFALSTDGTRIVLLLKSGAKARVVLGLVMRDEKDGLELTGLREVPLNLSAVLDVGWAEATHLAVLGATGDDPTQVYIVEIGGAASPAPRGVVADAAALAAAPGQSLVVATRDGKLLRQDPALRWRQAGEGSGPTYPG